MNADILNDLAARVEAGEGVIITITDPPWNADPTGKTDCSKAFQAAADFLASLPRTRSHRKGE